jgi:uncharacterized membrane protein YphA (DoxX/SURF4 family)
MTKKIIRIILGGILVFAAIMKILEPDSSVKLMEYFFFGPEYEVFKRIIFTIATIELVIGIFMISGFKEKISTGIGFAVFSLFFIVAFIGYLQNWTVLCGCFGEFSLGSFDITMLFRNFILLVATSIVFFGVVLSKKELPVN